ncbi:hypothetical protein PF008_g16242 [Phytophthora fragariae]|uniref:Peptidase S1 domain-containing protein n=1 Tax=Phytophthora fragariae TaxID=53985 RepID=A0A6G0RCX0_9STRA|nr:hypothetical protein PF008_g16242 [Phytophthora fragariae]
MGGGEVPIGTKAYVVGLLTTAEGNSFCGGALISPTHVLTTASCTSFEQGSSIPHWVAVGTHYINGTKDGERIKIVGAKNHTIKFSPIKLPAADDSDITPGMWSKVMGWGDTSFPNGTPSNGLQSVGLKDSCIGDTGDPLIKEKGRDDADDIVIGLVGWGYQCGNKGIAAVYFRVSAAIEWINSTV